MRIAHYNTYTDGGAAVLMRRLHSSLLSKGHESRISYRQGNLQIPDAKRIEYCSGWVNRQRERVQHRLETMMLRPEAPSYYSRLHLHKPTPLPAEDCTADIIHLHWIGRWLDLPSFIGSVPDRIPIVWTIHDMSPLAGGCFTDFGCDQLSTGCLRCPLLKPPFDRTLASNEIRRRRGALKGRKIIAVGNSRNTTSLLDRSALFHGIGGRETIHPAINPEDFIRHDKAEARRLLGMSPDQFVMGFGAASLTDENKGFGRFLDVAEQVAARLGGVKALVFGEGMAAAGSETVKVHALGKISSPKLQSLVYSAMDVFVMTSRMETFGQVATEAQACGTPVWAFDVGGLPDSVQNMVSGMLIPFPDTTAMAESICHASTEKRLLSMGQMGVEWVRNNFSTDQMADSYMKIYRQALEA